MKRCYLTALCIVLVSGLSACRTTLNYPDYPPASGADTGGAVLSGYFLSGKNRENDVAIQGDLTRSGWGTASVEKYRWSGKIVTRDGEQHLDIDAVANRMTDEDRAYQMNPVTVKGLPGSIRIGRFGINRGITLFKSDYRALAAFSVNDREFTVSFGRTVYNQLDVIRAKNIRLYITDSAGKVYGDFDMASYRIYGTNSSLTAGQLRTVMAVFSVVQHLATVI